MICWNLHGLKPFMILLSPFITINKFFKWWVKIQWTSDSIGLEEIANHLREQYQNRKVHFLRNSIYQTSYENGVSFVMTGDVIQSLFGITPVDSVGFLFGCFAMEGNVVSGEVFLDGLSDCEEIHRLFSVWYDDSSFNNLLNTISISVLTVWRHNE